MIYVLPIYSDGVQTGTLWTVVAVCKEMTEHVVSTEYSPGWSKQAKLDFWKPSLTNSCGSCIGIHTGACPSIPKQL